MKRQSVRFEALCIRWIMALAVVLAGCAQKDEVLVPKYEIDDIPLFHQLRTTCGVQSAAELTWAGLKTMYFSESNAILPNFFWLGYRKVPIPLYTEEQYRCLSQNGDNAAPLIWIKTVCVPDATVDQCGEAVKTITEIYLTRPVLERYTLDVDRCVIPKGADFLACPYLRGEQMSTLLVIGKAEHWVDETILKKLQGHYQKSLL